MIRVPVFRYGSTPTVVRLSLPARPWTPRDRTIGGFEKVASGARESWTQRRDRMLVLTVRVEEVTEFPALRGMIEYLQDNAGGPADLWLNEDDFDAAAAPIRFFLEAPVQGDDFEPARTDPGVFEVTLELTKEDGTAWAEAYFTPAAV